MPAQQDDVIAEFREALTRFGNESGAFLSSSEGPTESSVAAQDQAAYSAPNPIEPAWGIGAMLIESGGEHVSSLVKLMTEPIEPIACWTNVRSMLEPCAVAVWLSDVSIDTNERVKRTYAARHREIKEQISFLTTANRSPSSIVASEARMDEIERQALANGFQSHRSRRGRCEWIGMEMPGPTKLIEASLKDGQAYSLMSSVAHGHIWAIRTLGYRQLGRGDSAVHFEKVVDPESMAYLTICALDALARALWSQCQYFGWNARALKEIFETAAQGIGYAEHLRFWRS